MLNVLTDLYWLLPLGLLLAGYTLGVVFERIVLRQLQRLAARSTSEADDILVHSLKGATKVGFTLLGFYGAILTVPVLGATDYLKKILLIGSIAYGTVILARLAVGYVNLYAIRVRGILPSTTIFNNLTRGIIYVLGILVILQTNGIYITPVLTALGVGGLAVALALQDTLSNLFSGLQIIGSGQVRPGDFIQLESGEQGYVVDVTWRNTTIRELPNNTVIVPNSQLASSRVRNFNQPDKELAVLIQVGVSYGSDLEHVERVTIEVGREIMQTVPGGIPGFEPLIRYHTFGDSSINFTTVLRGNEAVAQYLLKHEFIKRLHERYKKEGIEIPFPIRTVYMKQGG